jgi:hypothetical protein
MIADVFLMSDDGLRRMMMEDFKRAYSARFPGVVVDNATLKKLAVMYLQGRMDEIESIEKHDIESGLV